jgi:hypothetical protein
VSKHTFERLDLTDPEVCRNYEQAFFTSFERVKSNLLIHSLWLWDFETRRLATRIPYEDQWIFAMRNPDGEVEAALAFNVAMTTFQSLAYDFAPPAETEGCFEVLTFFNPADRELGFKFRLWGECLRVLGARGFHTGFATTAPRPLGLYRRIGWKLVQQAEIAGEQRFFLRYSVPEHLRPAARPMQACDRGQAVILE